MTHTDQQVFEETRGRINRNLNEIAGLSRSQQAPQVFFPHFLRLACDCLNAQGGAVWNFSNGEPAVLASQAFDSSAFGDDDFQRKWITTVIKATASSKRPHIVAAEDSSSPPSREASGDAIGNKTSFPMFYHPIATGEASSLVLQIWLPQAGDPRTYNDISTFIAQLCVHAETYLKGWQASQLAARNDQAQIMLRLQGELVGELETKVIENSVANYLVDLLQAGLVCVFRKKGGRWQLGAASNQEIVDPKAAQSRVLTDAAEVLELSCEGATVEAVDAAENLRSTLAKAGVERVAWIHLSSSKNAGNDVLLMACQNEAGAFPAASREILVWAASQLGRALDAATHFQHIPFRPLASYAGRTLRAWKQDRRRKVLLFGVLPVIALAGLLLFPVSWKVTADCTVVPFRKATVVTETSGKVMKVAVHEGDRVTKGQILAVMDDTDYATQLAVSSQQQARWQMEAARAQALGNEAERKISEIAAAREAEVIRRTEFLRSRTKLVAPIDGVVLTRNLRNREGEAVEAGKPFCEISSTDGYELALDIRQQDLGDVLEQLGQGRILPVQFILHPHPSVPITTQLAGSGDIAQVAELRKTGSVFVARVPFPPGTPLEDLLKPGFTGKAKLTMGTRPLGWVMIRPFLNFVRVHWGV